MHMVAQGGNQRRMQQMRGAVGAHNGGASASVHACGDFLTKQKLSGDHLPVMQVLPALVLLDIRHGEFRVSQLQHTVIGGLAAHLRVKWSPVQNHEPGFPGAQGHGKLVFRHHGKHLSASLQRIIAQEHRGRIVKAEINPRPGLAHVAPGGSGPLPLLVHQGAEAFGIRSHAHVRQNILRKIQGETIGIIEPESVRPRQHGLVFRLHLFHKLRENPHSAVNRAGKAVFLGLDDPGDIALLLQKVGIGFAVFVNDGIAYPI